MDFVAVDVEAANSNLSSICQVGAAIFSGGRVCKTWETLVNPEEYFDPVNVWIHGIDEQQVRYSPTWCTVYETLRPLIEGRVVVSHTGFDRVSLLRACEKNHITTCEARWLDSAKVVRRAWPEFSKVGYGLANVAAHFDIAYKAHDALEDARCAGEILIRAISTTGLSIENWLERVNLPIHSTTHSVARKGDPDGPLYGEILVFTGAISMTRFEAADAAALAGCEVAAGVTKHTTLLVVGDQDLSRLAGKQKSSKQCKAEALIASGQKIRILCESDFLLMVNSKETLKRWVSVDG
ncbi:MAG: exonuclease domain-containing protein [Acidobacteriaceae bacterium]